MAELNLASEFIEIYGARVRYDSPCWWVRQWDGSWREDTPRDVFAMIASLCRLECDTPLSLLAAVYRTEQLARQISRWRRGLPEEDFPDEDG